MDSFVALLERLLFVDLFLLLQNVFVDLNSAGGLKHWKSSLCDLILEVELLEAILNQYSKSIVMRLQMCLCSNSSGSGLVF